MSLKSTLARLVGSLSPKILLTISYVHNRHKFPDLSHPRDLSEIMIKNILDGKINEYYYLADKYAVREFVASKGYGDNLVKLLGVYTNPDEIDFESLPEKFAIKLNFGAGYNIIVTDKSKQDYEAVRSLLKKWLKVRKLNVESHYDLIQRRIIIEDFIDDGHGKFPYDYKILCLNGKAHCVLACTGRETGHADYMPYDLNWNPLYSYNKIKSEKLIKKPANLDNMISMAEKLSEDIDIARIDLYSDGSRIWFGEFTLTPAGGIMHRWSQYSLSKMGEIYSETKKKLDESK